MGEIEIDTANNLLIIHSNIITYGNAATQAVTESIRGEIETMWNEPRGIAVISRRTYAIVFRITASVEAGIQPSEIYRNRNGRNNYFRIEDYSSINISFVDGIGCNSGYFFTENLYSGSSTAAHEYGHTIGLDHPEQLDIRGTGRPGIMYPRGTLVDPEFQYDPQITAGHTGGTMHPMYRKVRQEDIDLLRLFALPLTRRTVIIGNFTNIYHDAHQR